MFDVPGGKERVSHGQADVFADCEDVREVDAFAWPDEQYVDFSATLAEMTEYSHRKGMKNAVCVMLSIYDMSLEVVNRICSLPLYGQYRLRSLLAVQQGAGSHAQRLCLYRRARKPARGREEEIILAAYDVGARTIIAWGYYGSISNDYATRNAPVIWRKTWKAMARICNFERDRILAENHRLYRK